MDRKKYETEDEDEDFVDEDEESGELITHPRASSALEELSPLGRPKKPLLARCPTCGRVPPKNPITPREDDIKKVLAEMINFLEQNPAFFIRSGFANNIDGTSNGVFKLTTRLRSGDGWILAFAYDKFGKEEVAYKVLEYVNAWCDRLHGMSVVQIADDGGYAKFLAAMRPMTV